MKFKCTLHSTLRLKFAEAGTVTWTMELDVELPFVPFANLGLVGYCPDIGTLGAPGTTPVSQTNIRVEHVIWQARASRFIVQCDTIDIYVAAGHGRHAAHHAIVAYFKGVGWLIPKFPVS